MKVKSDITALQFYLNCKKFFQYETSYSKYYFQAEEKYEDKRDPVIESILLSSRKRQQAEASKPIAKWTPSGFTPVVRLLFPLTLRQINRTF